MLDADLNVSMPPAKQIDSKVEPPKCFYAVKNSAGQAIRNARVGELVQHQWSCPGQLPGVHAMLIKNCYAESGNALKAAVIDQNGCTTDSYILPNLQYASDLLSAKTQAPVFKFPDRTNIGFQCDVAICLRSNQDCQAITPPKCGSVARRRRELQHNSSEQHMVIHTPTIRIADFDGIDYGSQMQSQNEGKERNEPEVAQYCLTVAAYTCTIVSATFLVTTSAVIVGASFFTSTFRLSLF
ncbi:unnamed protein product [Gongylonema pulchrum]|uniref:ZP domain-containing protein n=1 Tax=Gongylonema pulchrum TaxID=637853 RepID=A0A183DSQ7_9BILA|nr:unnamed protein product [Gongylonema pulchrum]